MVNYKPFKFREQELLYQWFHIYKRSLPWRTFNRTHTRNPYKTWVSEIMLQQTQVSTVVPYFKRWMGVFPTIQSLAAAREKEVLSVWAGLGYYSRAKNLMKAAREVCRNFNGRLPRERKKLLALNGIGEYTAGAILSLAYNLREPILDGNLIRIFSRYYGMDFFPVSSAQKQMYWEKAAKWADCSFSQSVNEGLMELGALVCLSRGPRCMECPLQRGCAARRAGVQEKFPPPKPGRDTKHVKGCALVIECRNRVMIYTPRERELLRGHLTFPVVACAPDEISGAMEMRFPFLKNISGGFAPSPVRHTITHHKLELNIFRGRLKSGRLPPLSTQYRWVPAKDLGRQLVVSLSQKIWVRAGEIIIR